jgi:hypothetical protein
VDPGAEPDWSAVSWWDYKPFILSEAMRYTELYFPDYGNRFEDVLDHAIYLAAIAEKKFDPSRGYDFSTLLRWYLRGLHRFCQKEYRGSYWLPPEEGARARYLAQGQRRPQGQKRRGRLRFRINWRQVRPALIKLEQRQQNSLRLTEKAVLDWMISPDARKLSQVAEWVGVSKSYASKIRYRLLYKCLA